MANYNKCPKCGEYHWTHNDCPPEFLIYHEDYLGDKPKAIRAYNHEDAAVQYAKYYNTDSKLMNEQVNIKVVNSEGLTMYFELGAEIDIYYSTTEIEPF